MSIEASIWTLSLGKIHLKHSHSRIIIIIHRNIPNEWLKNTIQRINGVCVCVRAVGRERPKEIWFEKKVCENEIESIYLELRFTLMPTSSTRFQRLFAHKINSHKPNDTCSKTPPQKPEQKCRLSRTWYHIHIHDSIIANAFVFALDVRTMSTNSIRKGTEEKTLDTNVLRAIFSHFVFFDCADSSRE